MAAAKPSPVIFCVGSESWIKDQTISQLQATCIAPGFEDVDRARLSAETESDVIVTALQTIPFGSDYRLVIVEGLKEINDKALPWLAAYVEQPVGTTVLLVCANKVGTKKNCPAQSHANVQIVAAEALKGKSLVDWVVQQAQAAGKGMDGPAAQLLVERVGEDQNGLKQYLETLSLFVSGGAIQRQDVEQWVSPTPDETSFQVLDLAAAGHLDQALTRLHAAIAMKTVTPDQFVAALGWYYRMVWKARHQKSGGWMSPVRKTALQRLSRWSHAQLQSAMTDVLQADARLKFSDLTPDWTVDRLVLQLASVD